MILNLNVNLSDVFGREDVGGNHSYNFPEEFFNACNDGLSCKSELEDHCLDVKIFDLENSEIHFKLYRIVLVQRELENSDV